MILLAEGLVIVTVAVIIQVQVSIPVTQVPIPIRLPVQVSVVVRLPVAPLTNTTRKKLQRVLQQEQERKRNHG